MPNPSTPPYRIAMVSPGDPFDRRTWSGSTFFMVKALEKHVGTVTWIGPLALPFQAWKKQMASFRHRLTGHRSYPERTIKASRHFAQCIEQRLHREAFDLIFAPAASVEVSHLQSAIPLVYLSDATFALMHEIYPIFSAMGKNATATEHHFEQAIIERASLLVYPSQWAADSARVTYGAKPENIRVLPFGANLDDPPPRREALGREITGPIEMLFLAKEWERKGGEIAFQTLTALIDQGIEAHLTVCGIQPPDPFRHPKMTIVPYLNKNKPDERRRFQEILGQSHLLLLPTRAECYGIVFCEAAAYGLPVFAKEVGGIGTIVEQGVNGHLLPETADGTDFARLIQKTVLDPATYRHLNTRSRQRYEALLNWDAWGIAMAKEVHRLVPPVSV